MKNYIPNYDEKQELLNQIMQGASEYKKLMGKRYMIVFNDQCFELIFKKENFKHLTGVFSKNLSQHRFFKDALDRRLKISSLDFSQKQPYRWAKVKCLHLSDIGNLLTKGSFVVKDQNGGYPYIITDKGFGICLSQDKNQNGEFLDYYYPRSLQDGDLTLQKDPSQVFKIDYIFSKPTDQAGGFKTLEFMEDGKDIEALPEIIKAKISDNLSRDIQAKQTEIARPEKERTRDSINPDLQKYFTGGIKQKKAELRAKQKLKRAEGKHTELSDITKNNATEKS